VKHFVEVGFHPGALARSKDDGGDWCVCHSVRHCHQMLAISIAALAWRQDG
jgi:hypothetical protein